MNASGAPLRARLVLWLIRHRIRTFVALAVVVLYAPLAPIRTALAHDYPSSWTVYCGPADCYDFMEYWSHGPSGYNWGDWYIQQTYENAVPGSTAALDKKVRIKQGDARAGTDNGFDVASNDCWSTGYGSCGVHYYGGSSYFCPGDHYYARTKTTGAIHLPGTPSTQWMNASNGWNTRVLYGKIPCGNPHSGGK